ncbi:uncharacterized protein B0T15DRAFT_538348 [Chaetomium strumarium]|uniref:Uncharacterized protein n=1 Tax=Chaetomium strumarium TaxID=1170767 RepID=A0AAJ0GMS7_9PEZI|nr:hypothetical protein B0T15DRAFT_538348 [Chaetomium strumarium]
MRLYMNKISFASVAESSARRMAAFLLLLFWALPVMVLATGPRAPPKAVRSTYTQSRDSCTETQFLVCYGPNGGQAQNLSTDDIAYAAAYLRWHAAHLGDPLWAMPPETSCSEWTIPIPNPNTLLVLAKHVSPEVDSSVTYYDLARTIDGGGPDGTALERAASLLGSCGANGGQMGVTVNANDPAYHMPDYVSSGAKQEGIIVKLVRNPNA